VRIRVSPMSLGKRKLSGFRDGNSRPEPVTWLRILDSKVGAKARGCEDKLTEVAENVLAILDRGADALWHDRKKNKYGENDQVHDSLQHRGAPCPQRNYADEKR
jgi:hypothetical protein